MPKCAECGYLSLRLTKDRTIAEVEKLTRHDAVNPSVLSTTVHDQYAGSPFCFVNAFPLAEEIDRQDEKQSVQNRWKHVFWKERDCKESVEWRQGFTPREHKEIIEGEQLLEFQRGRDERQFTFQKEESEKNRTFQLLLERNAEKRHVRELAVMGGIVTLALIISQFLNTIFDHWLSK